MADPAEEPRLVEQDGSIVRIVAGEIEVIAEMTRGTDELVFDRLSIDGAGPGSVGVARLRMLATAVRPKSGRIPDPRSWNDADDWGESWKGSARGHNPRIIRHPCTSLPS